MTTADDNTVFPVTEEDIKNQRNAYMREWRRKNAEHNRKYNQEYAEKHKDKWAEYRKRDNSQKRARGAEYYREYYRNYRKKNREKLRRLGQEYVASHREQRRQADREYRVRNAERIKARDKIRRPNMNKGAQSANHRAKLLQRTPPWADMKAINAVYKECKRISRETGIKHHVDHIYPLKGRTVSGLHVHTNLQILPAIDNLRKHCNFENDALFD